MDGIEFFENGNAMTPALLTKYALAFMIDLNEVSEDCKNYPDLYSLVIAEWTALNLVDKDACYDNTLALFVDMQL